MIFKLRYVNMFKNNYAFFGLCGSMFQSSILYGFYFVITVTYLKTKKI